MTKLLNSLILLLSSLSVLADSPPNIVFLMTDDQRGDTVGCYNARKDVKTPHIDKLAEQGITFDNAYYAVAICCPSRATMMTRRFLSNHHTGFTGRFL